jgi:hypothetical protein
VIYIVYGASTSEYCCNCASLETYTVGPAAPPVIVPPSLQKPIGPKPVPELPPLDDDELDELLEELDELDEEELDDDELEDDELDDDELLLLDDEELLEDEPPLIGEKAATDCVS